MRLSRFLSEFPTLQLNLSEYLLAGRNVGAIKSSLARFYGCVNGDMSCALSQDSLMTLVHGRAVHNTSATYAGYQKFTDLPLVGKSDLVARADIFIDPNASKNIWVRSTSGTSGPAVKILYSESFFFCQQFATSRKIAAVRGLPVGKRPVHIVYLCGSEQRSETVIPDPLEEMGFFIGLRFDESNEFQSSSQLDLIVRLSPEVLSIKPPQLEAILLSPKLRAIASNINPVMVVSAGGILDESVRQAASTLFGCPVIDVYAMSEFGYVASECVEGNGMHLDISNVVAEFPSTPGGDGSRLLLSSFANKTMPLLRFVAEECVSLVREPCLCGNPSQKIKIHSGRNNPIFRTGLNTFLDPFRFNSAIFESLSPSTGQICDFWVKQLSWSSARIWLRVTRELCHSQREQIVSAISSVSGSALSIELSEIGLESPPPIPKRFIAFRDV